MSQVKFKCPQCGQHLEAEDMEGQSIVCPACNHEFAVPAAEVAASPAPVAEAPAAEKPAVEKPAEPTPIAAPRPAAPAPSNTGFMLKIAVVIVVAAAAFWFFGKKGGGAASKVMGELPADSLGAAALSNPGQILDDFVKGINDMEDDDIKKQMLDGIEDGSEAFLGFDITDKKEIRGAGFDLGAPICVSLHGMDDMEPEAGILSIGITSEKDVLKTIEDIVEDNGGDFEKNGDMYSLDGDAFIAVKGKRLYIGVGDDEDAIEDAIDDAMKPKKKLSGSRAFKGAMGKVGGGQLMGYVGLGPILEAAVKSMKDNRYVDEEALAVVKVMEENLASIAVALDDSVSSVYLGFADKAPLAKYFKSGASCGKMLKKIDEPLVVMTVSLADPIGIIKEVMEEALDKDDMDEFEEEMEDELGIDMDEAQKMFKKTAGGVALYMPKRNYDEPLILAFVKVNDKKKAADLLEDLLEDEARSKKHGKSEIFVMMDEMAAGVIDDYLVFGNAIDQIEDLAAGDTKKWKPRASGSELMSVDVRIGKVLDEIPEEAKAMLDQLGDDIVKEDDWVFASLASKGNGLLLTAKTSIKESSAGAIPGMLTAIAVPSFMQAREQAQRNCCINNMRQLDAGKEQWAMAQNKTDGDVPSIRGVNEYIKGNTTPICPAGGSYTYNVIGKTPECSEHGTMRNW